VQYCPDTKNNILLRCLLASSAFISSYKHLQSLDPFSCPSFPGFYFLSLSHYLQFVSVLQQVLLSATFSLILLGGSLSDIIFPREPPNGPPKLMDTDPTSSPTFSSLESPLSSQTGSSTSSPPSLASPCFPSGLEPSLALLLPPSSSSRREQPSSSCPRPWTPSPWRPSSCWSSLPSSASLRSSSRTNSKLNLNDFVALRDGHHGSLADHVAQINLLHHGKKMKRNVTKLKPQQTQLIMTPVLDRDQNLFPEMAVESTSSSSSSSFNKQ